MSSVKLNNKWIFSETVKLQESVEGEDKKFYLETRIIPFNEISRNRIKYNKESILQTHTQLIGKPLNHNHETNGANVFPRGEWINTEIRQDGMWGKAEVYNTKYNEDYIDWLKNAKCPRVSLQVNGNAENKTDENGSYKEAYIEDWLEGSTVIVPGFDNAKGNFIMAMAEAFKEQPESDVDEDDFFNDLNNVDSPCEEIAFDSLNYVANEYFNGADFFELPDEDKTILKDKLIKAIERVSSENPSEDDLFFDKLQKTSEKYEDIPDDVIDEIINFIKDNKGKPMSALQYEIKRKFNYLLDFDDLRTYSKLL